MSRTATRALLAAAVAILLAAPAMARPPHHEVMDFPWMFSRGRIGIQVHPMTPELRKHFGAPEDQGVLVVKVEEGRPAALAGVKVGDIALALDGSPLESPRTLARAIHRAPEDKTVMLEVLRKGKLHSITLEPEPLRQPWAEAEGWADHFERGLREGGRELERRLHDLEERLDDLRENLEKRLDELEDGQRA